MRSGTTQNSKLPESVWPEPTNRQVEVLLSNALDTCEAYYQAFQFVVWSGMEANRAMEAVLFETVGEA